MVNNNTFHEFVVNLNRFVTHMGVIFIVLCSLNPRIDLKKHSVYVYTS